MGGGGRVLLLTLGFEVPKLPTALFNAYYYYFLPGLAQHTFSLILDNFSLFKSKILALFFSTDILYINSGKCIIISIEIFLMYYHYLDSLFHSETFSEQVYNIDHFLALHFNNSNFRIDTLNIYIN